MPLQPKIIAAACLATLVLAATAIFASAAGKHLGTVGRTYTIAEPDALKEIQMAAAKVDWDKALDRKQSLERVKRYRPADTKHLPRARQNRTFLVDMTYTLDRDIPDGKGGILYPKGFTFNPLDYLSLTSTLVILDGSDPRQVKWFASSPHANDQRTKLIITEGDYHELIKTLGRPVFYLPHELADRLKLTAVPSVVKQLGAKMQVQQHRLSDKKENSRE